MFIHEAQHLLLFLFLGHLLGSRLLYVDHLEIHKKVQVHVHVLTISISKHLLQYQQRQMFTILAASTFYSHSNTSTS